MNAVIGIGFETLFDNFIETVKKLEIPTNKATLKEEVKDKLDSLYSTNLYISYSKHTPTVIFLEKIISIGKPFSIIDDNIYNLGLSHSKEFESVRDFIDKKAKIGLCVYSTRENLIPESSTSEELPKKLKIKNSSS